MYLSFLNGFGVRLPFTLVYLLHYLSCSLTHHSQQNIMQTYLWHRLFSWLCCLLGYEPKNTIVSRYYNLIFKYFYISHHVEFWNHQPVCCLWSFNQSSSNPLYSLSFYHPLLQVLRRTIGMPAQGILLFRSFSMYLMCLILILLIYTILSLPKLLICIALVE